MSTQKQAAPAVIFIWENFGPGHVDRIEACVRHFSSRRQIVAIEVFGKSSTYEWISPDGENFKKKTLFPNTVVESVGTLQRYWATLRACLPYASGRSTFLLCHYEHPSTLLLALTLRILRCKVNVMNDSKFDDYERSILRELGKSLFYLPYSGALASGERSYDYLRFLGIKKHKIFRTYNTLSLKRLRAQATPDSRRDFSAADFETRHFTIVARLVPKKNLAVALQAYSIYVKSGNKPRRLVIAGSGQLEGQLRNLAEELQIQQHIDWLGFVQSDEISKRLQSTLALLLLSSEEQFGNVVIEAQAFKVPCIVSINVGARDHLIRTGVSGFVVEPDNPEGVAFFMAQLANDLSLWQRMTASIEKVSKRGDVAEFALAVESLLESQ